METLNLDNFGSVFIDVVRIGPAFALLWLVSLRCCPNKATFQTASLHFFFIKLSKRALLLDKAMYP